jgi:3-oxoacyl-[acyl-carrier-protein] synthase II
MSSDAFHMTQPAEDADGQTRAMRHALADAAVAPDQVEYINAHGTSTPYNDRLESLAIRRVFGSHAEKLAVSSTKSMTGHLLGAAGALETAVVALTLRDQHIAPTINLDVPGDGCDLDYVPKTSRRAEIRYALNNAFGFGGTNASLLLKRLDA